LILKDLETVSKRLEGLTKEIKMGGKEAKKEQEVLLKAKDFLERGKILSEQDFTTEDMKIIKQYQLLTSKPRLYLLNGNDEEVLGEITEEFEKNKWSYLAIDLLSEFEAVGLNKEERKLLGLSPESNLDNLIKKSYDILNLITFLTTGSDETRAWTVKRGSKAPQAAGVIHSDFEKNFIRAEVINWQDLLEAGGFAHAREKGLIRTEGKDYEVRDGDVIEVKI
jgi:ribosome-binding ATPase YchF (GTP1/OBG family)